MNQAKKLAFGNKALVIFRAIFFLFVWLYLGVFKEDLLYKFQESSYFLFDSNFIGQLLSNKSGLLIILSRFILQFCFHPILGAGIIALLLSGIELLCNKIFSINKNLWALGFVPSFCLLTLFNSVSYEVYTSFESSYAICNIIGFYFSLLAFFIYKKTKNSLYFLIPFAIIVSVSSIETGPSAFIAVLLIVGDLLVNKKNLEAIIVSMVGCLTTYLSAKCSSYYVTPAYLNYSLLFPWPNLFFSKLFFFTILAHLIICIILTLSSTKRTLFEGKSTVVNLIIGSLFALTSIVIGRYPTAFGEELKLQRLTHQMEWKELTKTINETNISSKVIAAYRTIGLITTDKLNQKLFEYDYNYYEPDFNGYHEEVVYYPDFMLYASFPKISYRWSMEAWTSGKESFCTLQQMVLASFLNEEYRLCHRYLSILEKSLFYKDWAKQMQTYLRNPDGFFKKYPVMVNIQKNRPFEERSGLVSSVSELYLEYKSLSVSCAERRLLSLLYRRELEQFQQELSYTPLLKTGLPKCMQEA